MQVKRRGWTLVSVLLAVLAAMPAAAQVALTTVQDTVYSATGEAAQGTVLVSWTAFTTAAGQSVAAGTTSAVLGAGGALQVALAPNAGATPTGSYYTAVFHLSDGTTSRQYWVVPVEAAGATVGLAAIDSQVLPASVAVQTVSKSYVDAAIAHAVSGGGTTTGGGSTGGTTTAYVQKTGDTMTGPLVLPADPVAAKQAADKNYVDTNVAQIAAGLGSKVSTVPTAAQTVAQPAGTQLEVNRLNGVLDATGFLSGTGNNGIANALASTDCTTGCAVVASATYPGSETVNAGAVPSGGRVQDFRGGADSTVFVNPATPGTNSYFGSSKTQLTTKTAQQMASSGMALNSYVESLSQVAATGGSNQLPGSHEAVPYGKSNYGVLQLTGSYNAQGQHVQLNNDVYCYSVGDCLAGGQFIESSGGYRDEADEGTHPFDLQVSEDTRVFSGTCASGCTTGSTNLFVGSTVNAGTQGEGRYLIDTNPAKVISQGQITGAGGDLLEIVNFSGTSFPVSVFFTVPQQVSSQPGILAPGTVTVPISTSAAEPKYATTTSGLPASGLACVADGAGTGTIPNFEMVPYTVVDATHLQMTFNKVHFPGFLVGIGGLCGYGLESTVDTVGNIRQLFPVLGSLDATHLYYAGANTGIVGSTSGASTGGFTNASLGISSITRSGGTVTLTTASNQPYDMNGLKLTVSGVTDGSYNGTFQVNSVGPNTFSYAQAGADGSSSGGTVGIVTGGYNLYPMAEVLSVANSANNAVDGTMTLAPNTVAWAAGDSVEQPHYYQQLVDADTELVTQFLPRPIQYNSAGKFYGGMVGAGTRGWEITNGSGAGNYVGGGGTHQPPDAAFLGSGVWRNSFETDAGVESVFRIHCNLHGCNRWDSAYNLFAMDTRLGEDFLSYDPNTNTATWALSGIQYTFSPSGFAAPEVTASNLVVGGNLQAGYFGGGTWIDMPTTGPSGIGSGGKGQNPWIAYAALGGQYFINAQAGDIAIRNGTGALLFGNDGSQNAVLRLTGNVLQIGLAQQANFSPSGVLTAPSVVAYGGGASFQEALYTPANSSAPCTQGQFADDANFHYVCVATNSWKRAALSAF